MASEAFWKLDHCSNEQQLVTGLDTIVRSCRQRTAELVAHLGEVSLTVAAVLKPYLTVENQDQLLASVAGKSIQQARESLAAFPKPDVAPSVRKLPERKIAQQLDVLLEQLMKERCGATQKPKIAEKRAAALSRPQSARGREGVRTTTR